MKIRKIILTFICCVMFTGCIPHVGLQKRSIAEAIGIDYKKGYYSVNIQYYSQKKSGDNGVDASSPNVLTMKGSGKTLSDAIVSASVNGGKEILFGENRLIVIGRETCEKVDLYELLKYFVSNEECHPKMRIAVSETTAEDILNVKFTEGIVSAERLNDLLDNAQRKGLIANPMLYETIIRLQGETKSAYLPLLKMKEDGTDTSEDGKNVAFTGCAIFNGNRLKGTTDLLVSSGIQLLSDQTKQTDVVISENDSETEVSLYNISTYVKPRAENGKVYFDISVNADAIISEGNKLSENDKSNFYKKEAEKALVSRIENALKTVVYDYGCDIMYLENKLRQIDINAAENWDKIIKQCKFTINAEVTMFKRSA